MPLCCFVLIILVGHAQLSNLPKRVPVYNETETKLDYTYLLSNVTLSFAKLRDI